MKGTFFSFKKPPFKSDQEEKWRCYQEIQLNVKMSTHVTAMAVLVTTDSDCNK